MDSQDLGRGGAWISRQDKCKIKIKSWGGGRGGNQPTKVYFLNKNTETFCHLNKGRKAGEAPHPSLTLRNGQILSETKSMA